LAEIEQKVDYHATKHLEHEERLDNHGSKIEEQSDKHDALHAKTKAVFQGHNDAISFAELKTKSN
jgi:hypothetical protein